MGVDTLFLCFCESLSPQHHDSRSCCECAAHITVLTLCLCCSGGSGAERRQCGEAVFHVQEPDEDPQQEEQTAQDGLMMMKMMKKHRHFRDPSESTYTFKHRYSQFHSFLDMWPSSFNWFYWKCACEFFLDTPFCWRSFSAFERLWAKAFLLAFINIIWFVFLLGYAQRNYIAHLIDCFWFRLKT